MTAPASLHNVGDRVMARHAQMTAARSGTVISSDGWRGIYPAETLATLVAVEFDTQGNMSARRLLCMSHLVKPLN